MSIVSLLQELDGLNIKIRLQNGELTYSAPKGALTKALKAKLQANKVELITFLQESELEKIRFPVSLAQQRIILAEMLSGPSSAYTIAKSIKITGALDIVNIDQAIHMIADRHKILSTKVCEINEEYKVQLCPEVIKVEYVDLSTCSKEAIALERCEQDAQRPFHIMQERLSRFFLYKLDDKTHILMVMLHHIVADGRSITVLINEFTKIYYALVQSITPNLPEIEAQYWDYAEYQNRLVRDGGYDAQCEYWQSVLKGVPSSLDLPYDKAFEQAPTVGGRVSIVLPTDLKEGIVAAAKVHQTTLFVFALSVFHLLLAKYTRTSTVYSATSFSNRGHKRFEHLIGTFVNNLIFKSDIDLTMSLRDFVASVQSNYVNILENQDVPYEYIINSLRLKRDQKQGHFLQVFFVLHELINQNLSIPNLEIEEVPLDLKAAQFDINASLLNAKDQLTFVIEYNKNVFEHDTVLQLAENYTLFLKQAIDNPSMPVHKVGALSVDAIASTGEKQEFYGACVLNKQLAELVHGGGVCQSQVVIKHHDFTMTNDELEKQSNQVSHWLCKKGVKRGTGVAIFMERSVEAIIAMKAIMKAGGYYVPIDVHTPSNQQLFILQNANVRVLISHSTMEDNIPVMQNSLTELIIDTDWETEISTMPEVALPLQVEPNDLMYMMYTSGTTGAQKGVCVQYKNVLRLVNSFSFLQSVEANKVLHYAPIAFDASTFEIWVPLCLGMQITILTEKLSHEDLGAFLVQESITIAWLTSGLFNQFIESLDDVNDCLRYLLVGGDIVSYPHVSLAYKKFSNCQIINGYGPTECATFVSIYLIPKTISPYGNTIPIGLALPKTNAIILDDYMNVLPPGIPGKLYVSGDAVSVGYWKNPKLTAERFLPNIYSEKDNADRMYDTGDVVRSDTHGVLYFLGREDQQIKVRGYRIELNEIESVISQYACVKSVAVIVRSSPSTDKQIIAFVKFSDTDNVSLQQQLKMQLPPYMRPSYIVPIEEMPLTSNGKINRKQLAEKHIDIISTEKYIPPSTDLQKSIAVIWSELLGVEKIGLHDNFFDLGGHSLIATQIISRVKKALKIEVPLSVLFQTETLKAFAESISNIKENQQEVQYDIRPIDRCKGQRYSVSFAQQRMWFLSQFDCELPLYNIVYRLTLEGSVDQQHIRTVFEKILDRHEALRVSFHQDDAGIYQSISNKPCQDFFKFIKVHRQSDVDNVLNDCTHTAFNLSEDPLLKVVLIEKQQNLYDLILVMHHIVSDGWSAGILVKEFSQYYQAILTDAPVDLQPLSIQYIDYAHWQRNNDASQAVYKIQLQYWEKKLAELNPILELPYDFSRPKIKQYEGGNLSFSIPKNQTDLLHKLANQHGVSLYMALLSVFYILLFRYSSSQDIAVRTPIAGREIEEVEPIIGYFINTLILRCEMSPNLSFVDVLKEVKTVTLEAYQHQSIPFENIVEAMQCERALDHLPFSQITFVLQNAPVKNFELPDISVKTELIKNPLSKSDLALAFIERANGLEGGIEYSVELFEHATIERMALHFSQLLASVIAEPETAIQSLSFLTSQEVTYAINFPKGESSVSDATFLHKAVEAHAISHSKNVAIRYANQTLTYGELNQVSNALAQNLLEIGVSSAQGIAIVTQSPLIRIICMLSTLKLGCFFIPLDQKFPQERLKEVLADSSPSILLYDQDNMEELHSLTLHVGQWFENLSLCAQFKQNLDIDIQPTTLAYTIYTSGSTGKPKGVMIPYQAITLYSHYAIKRFKLLSKHVVAFMGNCAADFTYGAIFPTLTIGATLQLIDSDDFLDPDRLLTIFKKYPVDVLKVVPSHLSVLMKESNGKGLLPKETLILGGEALDVKLVLSLQQYKPNIRIINHYGPSEATSGVLTHEINEQINVDQRKHTLPIGRKLPHAACYVLDDNLMPVPTNVPGQLYIGGLALARGYRNRIKETADRFMPDPFLKKQRMYKTGDLVKYDNDGKLFFVNRIDSQVKLRGHRIELEEIKSRVLDCDFIKHAAVIFENVERAIIACVVFVEQESTNQSKVKKDLNGNISTLRQFLSMHLPTVMVPSRYVILDKIPLLPNGKLDQQSLLTYVRDTQNGDCQIDDQNLNNGPVSSLEQYILDTLKALLSVEVVSLDDNFFVLGGHSLLATQLIVRLRKQYQIDLPIRTIFEEPTIRDFAQIVQNLLDDPVRKTLPAILPVKRGKQPLSLSFSQKRLWFLYHLEGPSATYNRPIVLRLSGQVNIGCLKQAIQSIIDRHEILRTFFPSIDGEPVQIIHQHFTLDIPVIDLQSSKSQQHKVKNIIDEVYQHTFELDKSPPFMAKIIQVSPAEFVLAINIHHILTDGWSVRVFVKDFKCIYTSLLNKTACELPKLALQYADYAVWQNQWFTSHEFEEHKHYWLSKLSDIPLLTEMPIDFPRPSKQIFKGKTEKVLIPTQQHDQLLQICQQEKVTLFSLLFAIFNLVLYKHSGQMTQCIGVPIANRLQPELEDLIGFFVNTLVLKTDINQNTGFSDYLSHIQQTVLEAHDHQNMPFEKLVELLNPERSMQFTPLFQIMFILQDTSAHSLSLPNMTISEGDIDYSVAKFELVLQIYPCASGLDCRFEYNAYIYSEKRIKTLMSHFTHAVNEVISNIHQSIKDIQIVTPSEINKMLEVWSGTECQQSKPIFVHDKIAKQAALNPNKSALIYKENHITYMQMVTRVTQIAGFLQSKGIMPDDRVVLFLDPGFEQIIALLSVLFSGGCYVPVDTHYPMQRVMDIISFTKPKSVLTTHQYLSHFSALEHDVLDIDAISDECESASENHFMKPEVTEAHLAYLIYTSGSTGVPKGVMCHHGGLSSIIDILQKKWALQCSDRVIQHTSISFDISVEEILHPLTVGAALVITDKAIQKDPVQLLNVIDEAGVTDFHAVPTMLSACVQVMRDKEQLASLKRIISGGEVLHKELIEQLHYVSNAKLYNVYGPTEAAYTTLKHVIDSESSLLSAPLGKPIGATKYYILDENLKCVPEGATGELYIAGAHLARGYFNLPKLTAATFIPNPFGHTPGERMYKTGDRVKFLPNGEIQFICRVDHQVKLRGYRIELGEIETVLRSVEHVEDALVVVSSMREDDAVLVAYLQSYHTLDVKKLNQALKGVLPEYMIPQHFVTLESFPVNNSGKIDRLALPKPVVSEGLAVILPETAEEKEMASIWQNVLQTSQVGVNQSFFELGGHSLLAIILMARIEDVFKKRIPVSVLFQYSTIKDLLEYIACSAHEQFDEQVVRLRNTDHNEVPLFLIHPAGGGVFCYNSLVNILEVNYPIYGIQSDVFLDSTCYDPKRRIEDFSDLYIQKIKSIQPNGPYKLGGWSFGGVVAYEMANKLHMLGDTVEFVLMFDSHFKADHFSEEVASRYALLSLLQERGLNVTSIDLSQYASKDMDEIFKYALLEGQAQSIFSNTMTLQELKNQHSVLLQSSLSMMNYCPSVNANQIILIRANQLLDNLHENDFKWENYADNLKVFYTNSNHYTILKDVASLQSIKKVISLLGVDTSLETLT